MFHTFNGNQSGQPLWKQCSKKSYSLFTSVITKRRKIVLLYARQLKYNGIVCNQSLSLVFITEFYYDSHLVWITGITFGILIIGRHAAFNKYLTVRMYETVISIESTRLSRVKLVCCSLAFGNCHIPNGWWRLMKALVPFFIDVSWGHGRVNE